MWYGSECWSCKCIECFSPNMFSPHEIGSVKDLSCWCSSIQDILRTRMVFSAIFWMACMLICLLKEGKKEWMYGLKMSDDFVFHAQTLIQNSEWNWPLCCLYSWNINFLLIFSIFFSLYFNIFSPHRKIPSTLRFM